MPDAPQIPDRAPDEFALSIMLCDFAQSVNGKLYIMGGGWNVKGPEPSPTGVAALIRVPWSQTNRQHTLQLTLVGGNGQPHLVPTPMGEQPLKVEATFEVGRPAGATVGMTFNVPIGLNMPPLQFNAGQYEWRAAINGKERDDWRLAFTVLPHAPGQPG